MANGSQTIDRAFDPAAIRGRHIWWRVAAVLLLLVVLWFDSLTPAGIAVPALYVAPVLMFLWTGRYWESLLAAAIATTFTVADFYLFKSGQGREIGLMNRV